MVLFCDEKSEETENTFCCNESTRVYYTITYSQRLGGFFFFFLNTYKILGKKMIE